MLYFHICPFPTSSRPATFYGQDLFYFLSQCLELFLSSARFPSPTSPCLREWKMSSLVKSPWLIGMKFSVDRILLQELALFSYTEELWTTSLSLHALASVLSQETSINIDLAVMNRPQCSPLKACIDSNGFPCKANGGQRSMVHWEIWFTTSWDLNVIFSCKLCQNDWLLESVMDRQKKSSHQS